MAWNSRRTPTNNDDIIDSRDLVARLEELTEEREALVEEVNTRVETERELVDANASDEELAAALSASMAARVEVQDWDNENKEELDQLTTFLDEVRNNAGDSPEDGATLIRSNYFVTYAQQLADDLGVTNDRHVQQWPFTCIDWEQAAKELEQDYSTITWGGVDYLVR